MHPTAAVLDLLRRYDEGMAHALASLLNAAGQTRGLNARDRALILLGLCAAQGDEVGVTHHGRLALDEGASPAAALEILMTSTISRGPTSLRTGSQFLAALPHVDAQPSAPAGERPLEYFHQEFGTLPDWVRILYDVSPSSLENYATLRRTLLRDGAASRKVKELLTVALNAADGATEGIRSHAAAALRHGATNADLLDVLVLSIAVCGIIGWINGITALGSDLEQRQARGGRAKRNRPARRPKPSTHHRERRSV